MAEQEKQEKKEKKPKGEGAPGGGGPGGKAQKQQKKPKGQQAEAAVEESEGPQQPAPPPRLIAVYRERIVPALQEKFGLKNRLAVPRVEKIIISMGLGKAICIENNKSKMEQAEKELSVIAGQRPVRCKSKKAVSNFKLRIGQETGLKVTLRGNRMYEFLDRLMTLAIPRVKDFRGLDPSGFDKDGNYNFGFTEQTVFPEVDIATVTFPQGMNITMVTTASTVEQGRELLKQFGMPFRDEGGKKQEK